MRRLVFIIPALLLAGTVAMFAVLLTTPREVSEVPSPFIEKLAPSFRLPALMGGAPVTEANFKAQVTVFNVFASWCLPCKAEHPVLMRIARAGKAQVIGLNYKNKPAAAKAWLKELGNPFARIAVDPKGRTAIDFGVYGVPETFIIDLGGRIRYKHIGPIRPEDYTDTIAPLIARLIAEGGTQ
jgi:cytochrome c biogenesis protein CcmG/thiol:disulfide interchange protein DsbE